MSCQVPVGLLVLRVCGQPAVSACSSCGTALCAMHAAAGQCPGCMIAGGQGSDNELTREAATRNQYYDAYGARPQFGDGDYFNAGDDESVRPGTMGFAAAAGETDDYDPFET